MRDLVAGDAGMSAYGASLRIGHDRESTDAPARGPHRVIAPDTPLGTLCGVSYLLRLVLPDRPGALGAVATALGHGRRRHPERRRHRARPGHAVDDLVVDLPPDRLADTLVTAAATVEGVQVESSSS